MARIRGAKWQGDAFYQGSRIRKTFASKEEAELWEKAVALSDATGAPLPSNATDIGSDELTLGGFKAKHFGFLWGDKKSPESAEGTLKASISYFGANKPLKEIDYEAVVGFVEHLKTLGNSNATINRKLASLFKLLKHAVRMQRLPSLPLKPNLKENQGRIRFITKKEEEAILNRFKLLGLLESYHMTRFLLYTGARRGEACKLEHRDVDLKRNTVTFWETKGNKPGTVPLTQPAREAVEWCLREFPESKAVFQMHYRLYDAHWNRIRSDLGYDEDPQFIPHILRHTCASRLVQAGVDLRRVQTWMRHKSIKTTLRYAHLAPDDLQLAAQALVA